MSSKNLKLQRNLEQYALKYKKPASLVLTMRFPSDFPFSPPLASLVYPRFQFPCNNVTFGGTLCMAILTHQGWNPTNDLKTVILQIKQQFEEEPAEISLETSNTYTAAEVWISLWFFLWPRSKGSRSKFQAVESLFRTANQVLVQTEVFLQFISRHAIWKQSVPSSLCFGWTYGLNFSFCLTSSESSFQRDHHLQFPLYFEIITTKGIRSHCASLEFTAAEGHIVMPSLLMSSLQITEVLFCFFFVLIILHRELWWK